MDRGHMESENFYSLAMRQEHQILVIDGGRVKGWLFFRLSVPRASLLLIGRDTEQVQIDTAILFEWWT